MHTPMKTIVDNYNGYNSSYLPQKVACQNFYINNHCYNSVIIERKRQKQESIHFSLDKNIMFLDHTINFKGKFDDRKKKRNLKNSSLHRERHK